MKPLILRAPQAAGDSRIAFERGRFRSNFLSRDVGLTDTNRSPCVNSPEGSLSNRVDHISAIERHPRFCESRRISNDIGAASCTAERYAALRRFLGLVASGRHARLHRAIATAALAQPARMSSITSSAARSLRGKRELVRRYAPPRRAATGIS